MTGSHTIAIVDAYSNPNIRANLNTYNAQFGSAHGGVVQFVMGDGAVRGLSIAVPGATLAILANRGDDKTPTGLDHD